MIGTARSLQSAKSKVMRHSTETTTFKISEGTPDKSMIVIGLPATGIGKIRDRSSVMLSRTARSLNMKAKRAFVLSALSLTLSRM